MIIDACRLGMDSSMRNSHARCMNWLCEDLDKPVNISY